jgi:hypothetical protein
VSHLQGNSGQKPVIVVKNQVVKNQEICTECIG